MDLHSTRFLRSGAGGSPGSRGRIPATLFLAGCSSFCAYGSFNLLAAALPLYLGSELGFGLAEVGAVVGLGYLLSFVAYAAVGAASDRRDPARYAVAGALAMALCVPLYDLFDGPVALALVSLWRGLAMSAFVVAVAALAGRVADPERRGAQLGAYGLFSNAAIALGPPAGLAVMEGLGARTLFLASSALAVLAAALATPLVSRDRTGPRSTAPASLRGWSAGAQALLVPAGAVAASGVCYGAVLAFMPGFLSSRGIANPGFFFTAEVPALLLLRIAAGSLSDRLGRPTVAGAGLALLGASTLGLFAVSGVPSMMLAGLVHGAGWALLVPATMAWLFDRAPEGRQGLASAANYAALDAGRATGALGLGYAAGASFASLPFLAGGLLAVAVGASLLVSALPNREP